MRNRKYGGFPALVGGGLRAAALFLLLPTLAMLIQGSTPREWFVDDTAFSGEIRQAAVRYGLDPMFVRAVVFNESRFNPSVSGSKGEVGLMQLLPSGAVADWARYKKIRRPTRRELINPPINLDIGCWYLSRAVRRWRKYRHGLELALAQYNAGESRAERWKPDSLDGEVISRITIPSTRIYVLRVMKRYRGYVKK